MTRCPRPHCGGQLLEIPIADRGLEHRHSETICSLCSRSPGVPDPTPLPVRVMAESCRAGHPSKRYGYWSDHGKQMCDRCNEEQRDERRRRNRIGLEAGRERGWRLEGRAMYKGRSW